MGTGQLQLPVPGGVPPSGVQACGQKPVTSSSTPANGAAARHVRLQFDQTTDEHWLWVARVPRDWVSGGAVKVRWGADVTSGNVVWKASLAPVVDSSDDLDGLTTNTVGTAAASAVPGTSGQTKETSVTVDTTDVAAERMCVLMVGRDAGDAGDTAAGDAWVVGVAFEYTS